MNRVYLGIGGNLARRAHARAAWQALKPLGKLRASPIYECPALGFESQPFFNWVVALETDLELDALRFALREIEFSFGRAHDAQKYQDRTLDIDILLFGDKVCRAPITLPREDVFRYPFVIQPLYDLAPELIIPGDGRTMQEIWQEKGPFPELNLVSLTL
ncbi:2-amino-4-hydroxy-6-hydroxymethyldihydropteridine diphosphokinase [Vibrio sp. SM6]|uniref:2-amino-4-hydroxy-6-hydroxymethyldihydropteridine diphosphokinase n=1 Tax=Vibrio agarilyticus TaxID=2726741 RepID=A0A7X8YFW3_9VIBR|nr:2-amino-4-hydroxy-6-hydroxymethyldihydropteridine diphosphokinase [Vibrio agarilyticus]